jgi:hypothetical protein
MRKPVWVRLWAWLFWLSLAFMALCGFAQWTTHVKDVAELGELALVVVGLPCLVIWVVVSVIFAMVQHHARQQAAIMRDIMRQYAGKFAPPPAPPASPRASAPAPPAVGEAEIRRERKHRVSTSPLGLN